jgi:hypothetical protein
MSSQEVSLVSELIDAPITAQEPATMQMDIHPEDPDDDWSTAKVRSGIRLQTFTAVLLGLLVLGGGFWGGVVAEKHHSGSSSATSSLSALASRFAAARGGTAGGTTGGTATIPGASGFGGAAASAASGIVTGVQGDILYVTDATTGNLIKVVVGPSVTVTRNAKSSLTGLQTGDTVVVQGTKAANGNVTATAVRATGAGVTAAGAGRGGFTGAGGTGFSNAGG